MNWTLKEIAELTNGRIVAGDPEMTCGDPVTDSRRTTPGAIFVPLRGERVDGHRFLAAAAWHGAAASLVRAGFVGERPNGMALVEVDEPALALQRWAHAYLGQLPCRVVGITGSTGKTTTKEMAAAVLSAGFLVGKNLGNLNTEIGLPLTVLQTSRDREVLVLEMGMRGSGEILQLTEIAPPDVAVITNIGETHIELLGSIQNIAAAKGEILQGLKAPGTAVLNADDPLVVEQSKRAPGKILWFGQTSVTGAASLWADQVVSNGASLEYVVHWQGESRRVHLPWPGRHNLHNSLAALAVGLAFDLSLKQCLAGLSAYSPADNRLRFVPAKSGALIIDDTYNASPVSMRAALQVLHDYPQGSRRIAVLGDMLELGTRGQAAHHELGQLIGGMQLSGLFTVGPLAELIAASVKEMGGFLGQVRAFRDNTALASFLDSWLMPDDLVLIKGSRGMHMEDIVSHLAGEEGNGSDH